MSARRTRRAASAGQDRARTGALKERLRSLVAKGGRAGGGGGGGGQGSQAAQRGEGSHVLVSGEGCRGRARAGLQRSGQAGSGAWAGGAGAAGALPLPAAGSRDRPDTGAGPNSRRQRPSEAMRVSRALWACQRPKRSGMRCDQDVDQAQAAQTAAKRPLRPHQVAAPRSAPCECSAMRSCDVQVAGVRWGTPV